MCRSSRLRRHARNGRVEPLVLEAVKEAQARGIVVILVTGRIMADLRCALTQSVDPDPGQEV